MSWKIRYFMLVAVRTVPLPTYLPTYIPTYLPTYLLISNTIPHDGPHSCVNRVVKFTYLPTRQHQQQHQQPLLQQQPRQQQQQNKISVRRALITFLLSEQSVDVRSPLLLFVAIELTF